MTLLGTATEMRLESFSGLLSGKNLRVYVKLTSGRSGYDMFLMVRQLPRKDDAYCYSIMILSNGIHSPSWRTEDFITKLTAILCCLYGIKAFSIVFLMKGGKGMAESLLRTDKEITQIYSRHVQMVYRVCYSFMKNSAAAEDMVQTVFLKLMTYPKAFQSDEHEKAWLIVTASNLCKDQLRHWWQRREPLEDQTEAAAPEVKTDETLEAVLSLPDRYKTAIYLYYYEGYSTGEIAAMLKKAPSTVRDTLTRGRRLLRKKLGGSWNEESTDRVRLE